MANNRCRVVAHDAVPVTPPGRRPAHSLSGSDRRATGSGQPTHRELTPWIFSQTVLGETLTKVGETITATGERRLLTLRGYIIQGFVSGDESFGRRQPGDPPGFQRAVAGNRYLRGEATERPGATIRLKTFKVNTASPATQLLTQARLCVLDDSLNTARVSRGSMMS